MKNMAASLVTWICVSFFSVEKLFTPSEFIDAFDSYGVFYGILFHLFEDDLFEIKSKFITKVKQINSGVCYFISDIL